MGQIQVLHREAFTSPPSHNDRAVMRLNSSVYNHAVTVQDARILHRIAMNIAIERSLGMLDIVTIKVQRLVRM
jgi:hypothetical protein